MLSIARYLMENASQFHFGNYKVFDENQEVAYLMHVDWGLGFDRNGYSENCLEFLRTVNMVRAEMIDHKAPKRRGHQFYDRMKGYESLLEENKRLSPLDK
jgi:hypothetical protein